MNVFSLLLLTSQLPDAALCVVLTDYNLSLSLGLYCHNCSSAQQRHLKSDEELMLRFVGQPPSRQLPAPCFPMFSFK